MENTIKICQRNKKVALSYSISGDIHNFKQMSAGVATIFKNHFGRPTQSDFVNTYLTSQMSKSGAIVYGPVTKAKFNGKPNLEDYDAAFQQLTVDFKKRQLQQLIFSPMGCIQHKIPLRKFAQNLVQFQWDTAASVTVVLYNKESKHLKPILYYAGFVRRLQDEIEDAMHVIRHKNNLIGKSHFSRSTKSSNNDNAMMADSLSAPTPTEEIGVLQTSSVSSLPSPSNYGTEQKSTLSSPVKCPVPSGGV